MSQNHAVAVGRHEAGEVERAAAMGLRSAIKGDVLGAPATAATAAVLNDAIVAAAPEVAAATTDVTILACSRTSFCPPPSKK